MWGTAADGTARDVTVADVHTVRDGQVVRMHAHAERTVMPLTVRPRPRRENRQ
jgi:hypothetical protein